MCIYIYIYDSIVTEDVMISIHSGSCHAHLPRWIAATQLVPNGWPSYHLGQTKDPKKVGINFGDFYGRFLKDG